MINKVEALASHVANPGEPDRMRFWELYNKYKDNLQEILELVDLMHRIIPQETLEDRE